MFADARRAGGSDTSTVGNSPSFSGFAASLATDAAIAFSVFTRERLLCRGSAAAAVVVPLVDAVLLGLVLFVLGNEFISTMSGDRSCKVVRLIGR